MLEKWFGRSARWREDRDRRAFVDQACRVAVGSLGTADDAPLSVYVLAVLVGYTQQRAVLARRKTLGLPNQPPAVAFVQTGAGHTYVFGDALSAALVGSRDEPGVLLRLAEAGGLARADADIGPWFAPAAATVGHAAYGRPRPPLDDLDVPSIDAATARAPAVWQYLHGGGLTEQQFAGALANVLLVTLVRAIDRKRHGSPEQLALMAIEAVIAGSHMLPEGTATADAPA